MLPRILVAVASLACSIAAIKFAQSKFSRHNSQEKLDRGGIDSNGNHIHAHANNHGEAETKEDAMHVSATSPSRRNSQDSDLLLLPEFHDLCQEVIDITLDSDNPIHGREDGRERRCDSASSIVCSQNCDAVVVAFEVLTEEDSRRSGSDVVEIARLNSVLAGMLEKESKLESELYYYRGLKEQQVELERQLHRKNEAIKKLNDSLIFLRKQRVELLEEVEDKEFLRNELECAQLKIKNLQKTIQTDANESRDQILSLKQQVSTLQQQVEDANQKDSDAERILQTLEDRKIGVNNACNDLRQQNKKLMTEFHVAESKIEDLQLHNEKLMTGFQEAVSKIEDLQLQNGKLMTEFQEAVSKIEDLQQQNEKLMTEFREAKSESEDLQQQNQKLTTEFRNAESKIEELSNITESEVMAKVEEQTSTVRQANIDLSKQLEDLQMSRLSEIEEMLDFRRLNTRLRYELEHCKVILRKAMDVDLVKHLSPIFQDHAKQLIRESTLLHLQSSPKSAEDNFESTVSSLPSTPSKKDSSVFSDSEQQPTSKKTSFIKRLRKWGRNKNSSDPTADFRSSSSKTSSPVHQSAKLKASVGSVSMRNSSDFENARNSTSDSNDSRPDLAPVRTSSNIPSFDRMQEDGDENVSSAKRRLNTGSAMQKTLRRHSDQMELGNSGKAQWMNAEEVRNIPSDLFQRTGAEMPVFSMRDEKQEGRTMGRKGLEYFQARNPRVPRAIPIARKKLRLVDILAQSDENASQDEGPSADITGAAAPWQPASQGMAVDISHVNTMISEIESPSEFMLAVKADIEKQGSFVRSLAAGVQKATFDRIEDVIVFVLWLDEELSFLVDEQAVLKYFDWPENKANTLREAALDYVELRKLETELSFIAEDDSSLLSLQTMHSLLQKVEQSMLHVLRSREVLIARYQCFSVPIQWMLDSGLMGKIKLATGKLARKYMRQVMAELDALGADVWTARGWVLMRQAVGFAKRAQQIAGRFDAESMEAFEQLRNRVYSDVGGHVSWA